MAVLMKMWILIFWAKNFVGKINLWLKKCRLQNLVQLKTISKQKLSKSFVLEQPIVAKQIVNRKNNLLLKKLNKVFSQHKAIEEQFVTPKNVGGEKNHFSQQNKL